MEKLYQATLAGSISLNEGEIFRLETERLPVVPPYLMIVPYIVVDQKQLRILSEESFPGEGVQGCTYRIVAVALGKGVLEIGFRDLRTAETVRKISITYTISR